MVEEKKFSLKKKNKKKSQIVKKRNSEYKKSDYI